MHAALKRFMVATWQMAATALAAAAPAVALPCTAQYLRETQYCYWRYEGLERQLCYLEAGVRYLACLRQSGAC